MSALRTAAHEGHLHSVTIQRSLAATPDVVWAMLSDTNRWDRLVGMGPSSYAYEQVGGSGARSTARVGRTRYGPFRMAWLELGEWAEGRFLWGERRFVEALITRAGVRFELDGTPAGTKVTATAYAAGRGPVSFVICLYWRARFGAVLRRYFDVLQGFFRTLPPPDPSPPGEDFDPPSLRVARALVVHPPREVEGALQGPRGRRDDHAEFLFERYRSSPAAPTVAERIVEHLRTRPDEQLRDMRPFELATAWELDRRDVLRGFLHACRAGLVDLDWRVDCPSCRVAAQTLPSLAAIEATLHCDACEVRFDVDFAENVEAVFRVNAAVRDVRPDVYCVSSPWFRPHVLVQLQLAPGDDRALDFDRPPGELLLRARGAGGMRVSPVGGARAGAEGLDVCVTAAALEVVPCEGRALRARNATSEPVTLLIERGGWSAPIVRGSVILTMPEFFDLFAADAPASGVNLSVGSLTVLFTDLTGSTALYERLGDARAFALVEDHFRRLSTTIAAHGGTVVKTIGDAVMAGFASPADGLRAALDIVHRASEAGATEGPAALSVKVALHEGPCLVVGANDRIDFFGTTVNLAARLLGIARADHVVVLSSLLAQPGVARVLGDAGLAAERATVTLRGLTAEREIASIRVRRGAP